MAYVTKKEIEEQKAELYHLNQNLIQQVPERIGELIEESETFSEFIEGFENKRRSFNTEVSNAKTAWEEHLEEIQEKEEAHVELLDEKFSEINQTTQDAQNQIQSYITTLQQKADAHIASIQKKRKEIGEYHKQNIADYNGRKDELEKLETNLENREEEAIGAIGSSETQSIEAIKAELESSQNEIKNSTEESVQNINHLTEAFKQLAGTAYYNKSSDKIADEYRKNAKLHKKDETKFQYIGGGAIIGAIVILLGWLILVICGLVSTENEYHWLPVATITSLFIFLSRWAARIAYRHGLEARRLNQFALELTAMPAFFAQELLNQGDTEFQNEGKKIVQEKSSKMFGNFERFDEQHSHSAMELAWKWVTKRFETNEDKEVATSLNDEHLEATPKPKAKKTIASDGE